jgi:hypothetical protein
MLTKKLYRKKEVNKTRKRVSKPMFITLNKNYKLYGAKSYDGESILKYNSKLEKETKNKCFKNNIMWLGDIKVAKQYKTKNNEIYVWKCKKKCKLLDIKKNIVSSVKSLFLKNKKKMLVSLEIPKKSDINYEHVYLNMNNNEKAYYEFCFAFGFLSLQEQYDFMLFIQYLIKNKILYIKRRDGKNSIYSKLLMKISYYKTIHLLNKQINNYENRLSFYAFDQNILSNLCVLFNNKIHGVYYKDRKSIWFPQILNYRMNLKEIILFRPHTILNYIGKYDD